MNDTSNDTTILTTSTVTYVMPAAREAEFLSKSRKTPALFKPFTLSNRRETLSEIGKLLVSWDWAGPRFAKRSGWTLAAKMTWTTKGASTVFFNVIDPTKLPEGPTCDHCQAKRHRSATFVAVNEAGDIKTLGGDCAQLYWGKALKDLPFFAEMDELMNRSEDEDSVGYGREVSRAFYDVRTALALTIPVIRRAGYISANSNAGGVPTKHAVALMQNALDLFGAGPIAPHIPRPRWAEDLESVDMASTEEVDAVVNWATEQAANGATSSYWLTVGEILNKGWFAPNALGFIVALPHGFSKRPVTASPAKVQKHIGVVGQRHKAPVTVTVTRVMQFETQFGLMTVTLMKDAEGNVIKSTGKMPDSLEKEGDVADITFFVKAHDMYGNVPQTIVNRVSVG
jgi:hypothetical protein